MSLPNNNDYLQQKLDSLMQSILQQQQLASKNVPKMSSLKQFEVGDEVVLLDHGNYSYGDTNPTWGVNGSNVAGIVRRVDSDGEVYVEWMNGMTNRYYPGQCKLEHLSKIKVKKSNKKIDFSHLDKVVLPTDTKDEITAVLRQFHTGNVIFEQWGLGEIIEYGKGMTFLFYGPPGTGKTWAATCMAKALGMDVLAIGAAEIQSSEPGGANRAIKSAFAAAKKDDKVLFIDECDSLVSSRVGVGMILGSEINDLLKEIEKFEGVVILATNMIENLDPALERRISLIVEFPEPDADQRTEIWKRMLPPKMPLGEGVTPEKLGEHKLTGGQIKNVVLQAARLALSGIENGKPIEEVKVTNEHFEAAIKRIHQSKNLMGSASRFMTRLFKEDAAIMPGGGVAKVMGTPDKVLTSS